MAIFCPIEDEGYKALVDKLGGDPFAYKYMVDKGLTSITLDEVNTIPDKEISVPTSSFAKTLLKVRADAVRRLAELEKTMNNRIHEAKTGEKVLKGVKARQVEKFKAYRNQITEATKDIEDTTKLVGALNLYINKAAEDLEALNKKINKATSGEDMTDDEKRSVISEALNYSNQFNLLEDFKEIVRSEEFVNNPDIDISTETIQKLLKAIEDKEILQNNIKKKIYPLVADWLLELKGESGKSVLEANRQAMLNKREDLVITKEVLIQQMIAMEEDISGLSAWVDSIFNTSDILANLLGLKLKEAFENGRLQSVEDSDDIGVAINKYLVATGKSYSQDIFKDIIQEVIVNGKTVKAFISELDYNAFEIAKKSFREKLLKKYLPKGSTAKNITELKEELKTLDKKSYKKLIAEEKAWYKENQDNVDNIDEVIKFNRSVMTEEDFKEWFAKNIFVDKTLEEAGENPFIAKGKFALPAKAKYTNKAYEKLRANKPAFELHQAMIAMMEEKLSLYPDVEKEKMNPKKGLYILPAVHKSTVESVMKGDFKSIWTSIKNKFTSIPEDLYAGESKKEGIANTQGERYRDVPIVFTEPIDAKDTSENLWATMTMFAEKANNYHYMNKIQAEVMLIKSVVKDRVIGEGETDKLLAKLGIPESIKKKVGRGRANERIETFLDMVYYGIMQEQEELMGINLTKLVNNLNSSTSYMALAFNLKQAMSNVTVGAVTQRLEALGGQFYSGKDLSFGYKKTLSVAQEMLVHKTTKYGTGRKPLSLQLYDLMAPIQGDFDYMGEKIEGYKVSALFSSDFGFLFSHMGDFNNQVGVMYAVMNNYTLKDYTGKEIKLHEAFELNTDGKIQLKPGLTKIGGGDFTLGDLEVIKNRIHALNKDAHGIYNMFDKSAANKYALLRMAFQFKGWLVPLARRRFQEGRIQYEQQAYVEGYYRTLWKALGKAYKDAQKMGLKASIDVNLNPSNQIPTIKGNLRKVYGELGFMAGAIILTSIIGRYLAGLDDEEEDDIQNIIALNAYYNLLRTQSEMSFYINPIDMSKILTEPIAGQRTIKSFWNVAKYSGLTLVDSEDAYYKRQYYGHEKGDSKLVASLEKVIPVWGKLASIGSYQSTLEQVKNYDYLTVFGADISKKEDK
jgi:hypothetical protein